MDVSIVIVNYNVRFFLEQCLLSVEKAIKNLDAEVFVVDNNSNDTSLEMIRQKFDWVKLIANKENLGFSKANNQAISQSSGRYILLLNPDTIIEEDTLEKCVQFMDQHDDAGGLGVKMVDGHGNFLPESKRGLPTPRVAFYKIFGLSRIFPKSKKFAQYHLGYLNEDETHEIEVLSGAFMFLRKSVLEKIGLLDETFFMYGEDIDLSYRVTQAGYKNYYYPETKIIHYKGESTKKSSINYVFVFYNAMVIFARKHFSDKNARSFSLLINIAIYVRAFAAILSRFFQRIALPVLDISILFTGMLWIKQYYESSFKHADGSYFPVELVQYGFPIIIGVFICSILVYGGYKGKGNLTRTFKGVLLGIAVLFVAYALLNEEYRFSRAMMIMISVFALIAIPFSRILLHVLNINSLDLNPKKRVAIVGFREEAERIKKFLLNTYLETDIVAMILPTEGATEQQKEVFEGKLYQLRDLVEMNDLNEIIFCSNDISFKQIVETISTIPIHDLTYKVAPAKSNYIIASDSVEQTQDAQLANISELARKKTIKLKRLFDVMISTLFLLFTPILILLQRDSKKFLSNIFSVIKGDQTWVGVNVDFESGGNLTNGVIDYPFLTDMEKYNDRIISYLLRYSVLNDLMVIFRNIRNLGS